MRQAPSSPACLAASIRATVSFSALTVAGLSMALYLLQTLHSQGKPGYEHLIRDEPLPDEDDESEGIGH